MSKEKMNEEMREINQESMSCSFVRGMGTGPDDCMDPADYEALDAAGALSSPVYVCGWGWTLPTVNVYGSGSGSGSDSNTGSGSDHDWEYGSGYNYGSGYGCGYNCGCNCNCGCDFCCGGYGSGYGSGCGCDCGCPFCGSGCGDTSGGTSGGSNNGNNENTDNNPVIKEPVELMDVSKFKKYGVDAHDCMDICELILEAYHINNPGKSSEVIRLADTSNKQYVENWGEDPAANYAEGIRCLDAHLEAGRVIIVGVDYNVAKTITVNPDGTDHFIVVTGRGYDDSKGMYYYTFMETATKQVDKGCSPNNRLYYDPEKLSLSGHSEYQSRNYVVTHIRPNDEKSYNTSSLSKTNN